MEEFHMAIKKCRVCGKEYSACKNSSRNPEKKLRWQEFACSAECGNEYFAQIRASRNASSEVLETPSLPSYEEVKDEVSLIEIFDEEGYMDESDSFFDYEDDDSEE